MLPLLTHVKNGRIVVDEPTDLPDGTPLVVAPAADDLSDLSPEERAELDVVLDAGIADMRAGRVVDGHEVVRRLLARNTP